MAAQDRFGTKSRLVTASGTLTIHNINALEGFGDIDRLPYSIKVLLESCVRNHDGFVVTDEHVRALATWDAKNVAAEEVAFMPGRVVLQDFTGVPAVVDFAALRGAMARLGGDVARVNPLIRADLVVDHSVQVDAYGGADAMAMNTRLEFQRNGERYELLKWGQASLDNFTVVPPATGIVHQVNLEHLAGGVLVEERDGERVAFPDSLVGTDSHTTMINGLGVVGWGVGGIEAEACMLGQPIVMSLPEVVGVELTGTLREGTTATDLVLTLTQLLRAHGVVEKFVEFHGEGLDALSLADRATIANMAPEYGATVGFFPTDAKTLDYLRLTGRDADLVDLVERYTKKVGLWRDDRRVVTYSADLTLDLDTVEPSLAGPTRPQDRIALSGMKRSWQDFLAGPLGHDVPASPVEATLHGETFDLEDGAVVIAAITSCTNTSNPAVMIAAGLVAQKARARGLRAKPWVKTSLAPGSRVVTDYLMTAGLLDDLEAVGFYTVGYGCTTCIGNSGPLAGPISDAIKQGGLAVASVLSGNRNFEGRVSPETRANYLASPPLVVAYALAGTVDWHPHKDALGEDADGNPVMLKDLWPTSDEIAQVLTRAVTREQFHTRYADVYAGPEAWQALGATASSTFPWDPASTYVQEPPFFRDLTLDLPPLPALTGARALALLGDSVTTDHISPAGTIPLGSPAGRYLVAQGVARADWNSFGSRRGNDRVMTRGTFGNIRIKNRLAPGVEGGFTTYLGPDAPAPAAPADHPYLSDVDPRHGEVVSIYDAAVKYQGHGVPLVILAGRDYGMGSSRDWAAKGTYLLGVRAVIAESFERIHRSNLVGMGVLPLEFAPGESAASLGLSGRERFDLALGDALTPRSTLTVTATADDGRVTHFTVKVRVDTPVEVEYYRNGGILHTVLRRLAQA